MVEQKSQDITEDEATLYDRQIRLWGLESQKRLRAARVLVIGLKGLGAEICKNIILGGVKSVEMLDADNIKAEDYTYQFLAQQDCVGKNIAENSLERAQQLNPMVNVTANTEKLDDVADSHFTNFDVIVATQCTLSQIIRLNQICRLNGIKFFAGDVFGFYGYTFSDLQLHDYTIEKLNLSKASGSVDAQREKITVKASEAFVPFRDLLDVDWTTDEIARTLKKMSNGYFVMRVLQAFRSREGHDPTRSEFVLLKTIRDSVMTDLSVDANRVPDSILEQLFSQVSPVCAIVGGILAQEIIKAVSQSGKPFNNCFFFDPQTYAGKVECIGI